MGLQQVRFTQLSETTGAATELASFSNVQSAPGSSRHPNMFEWGFEVSATRFVVVNESGSGYHINHSGGVVGQPFIDLGSTSAGGGFYTGGVFTTSANPNGGNKLKSKHNGCKRFSEPLRYLLAM